MSYIFVQPGKKLMGPTCYVDTHVLRSIKVKCQWIRILPTDQSTDRSKISSKGSHTIAASGGVNQTLPNCRNKLLMNPRGTSPRLLINNWALNIVPVVPDRRSQSPITTFNLHGVLPCTVHQYTCAGDFNRIQKQSRGKVESFILLVAG